MSEYAYSDILLHLLILKKEVSKREAIKKINTDLNGLQIYSDKLNDIYNGILRIQDSEDKIYIEFINEKYVFNILRMGSTKDFNDPDYRIAYLLLRLITINDYINIDDLSEEMTVSRSTVNNDIKKAKQALQKFNGKIKGIPNRGIILECDEFSIRLVMIYLVYDLIGLTYLVDIELQQKIAEVISFYKLDSFRSHLLYKTMVVTIGRAKLGYHLEKSIPMYKNIEANSFVFNELTNLLKKNSEIKLSNVDVDFLSFPINTRNSAYVVGYENNYNYSKLRKIVHQMLNTVKKQLMISIDEINFFEKVKYHLLFLINRLTFRLPNSEIASIQVKTRFPLAYELAKVSLNVLYELYSLKVTETDISYLAIYYALILNERDPNKRFEKNFIKKIALVTNSGQGTTELIEKQIIEVLGSDIKIQSFTVKESENEDLKGFNVVFTTEEILSSIDIPLIQIDTFIDQGSLTKEIKKIEPHAFISKKEDYQDIQFSVHEIDENSSYIENTKRIIKKLFKENKDWEKVYKIFLDKENVNTMMYENNVAFPHITDKNKNTIHLAIGTTKEMNSKMNLIFFLSVPESLNDKQEIILTKLYDKIFAIISNKKMIKHFQTIESSDEFISLLNREEREG